MGEPNYCSKVVLDRSLLNSLISNDLTKTKRERERERERAIRTGTFVTKKGHFCNATGNFCNQGGELL